METLGAEDTDQRGQPKGTAPPRAKQTIYFTGLALVLNAKTCMEPDKLLASSSALVTIAALRS